MWQGGCAMQLAGREALLYSGAPVTIELWLELESDAAQWQGVVYRGGNGEGGPQGWTLELGRDEAGTGYLLQLCGKGEDGTWACQAGAESLAIGSLYHVAVVRIPPGEDCGGAGSTGCAKFYIGSAELGFMHREETVPFAVDWQSAEPLSLAENSSGWILRSTTESARGGRFCHAPRKASHSQGRTRAMRIFVSELPAAGYATLPSG